MVSISNGASYVPLNLPAFVATSKEVSSMEYDLSDFAENFGTQTSTLPIKITQDWLDVITKSFLYLKI